MQLVFVAVVARDVEHTRQAPSEACREATLVERDVLDGIGVESREETAQVVDVVQRHAVKQEQVLVGTAAAHIHTRHTLRAALHAGQQLQGLQHVGFAKKHGYRFDLLYRYVDGTHLRRAVRADAVGTDSDGLQLGARFHLDVHFLVSSQFDGVEHRLVAHIRHPEHHFALGQRQRVAAFGIGQRALARQHIVYRGAYQRLAARRRADGAADGIVLRHTGKGAQRS